MHILRSILCLVVIVALSLAVGLLSEPPASLHPAFDAWSPLARTGVEGGWTWTSWVFEHFEVVSVIGAIVVTPVGAAWLVGHLPRHIVTDPQRLFTSQERHIVAELAGGRCEGETLPFIRCRGAAEQGDHWFPWSLGGATNMQNLVCLCQRCNSSKSNRVPTFWQTQRLILRRRRYYPEGQDPRPGAKFGLRP